MVDQQLGVEIRLDMRPHRHDAQRVPLAQGGRIDVGAGDLAAMPVDDGVQPNAVARCEVLRGSETW